MPVRVDVQLAVEIVLNFLSNAVKYAPEETTITVRTKIGTGCRIVVQDDGPGIPAEDLKRIFEPFERLPGTEHLAPGSGLGLALSRSMATAMDARIDVESTHGGVAAFTLNPPIPPPMTSTG